MNDDTIPYASLTASFVDWEDQNLNYTFRFKKPSKEEVSKTTSLAQKKARANQDTESVFKGFLIRLIHPEEKETFEGALEEHYGLVETFSNAIYERLGFQAGN